MLRIMLDMHLNILQERMRLLLSMLLIRARKRLSILQINRMKLLSILLILNGILNRRMVIISYVTLLVSLVKKFLISSAERTAKQVNEKGCVLMDKFSSLLSLALMGALLYGLYRLLKRLIDKIK